MKPNSLSLAALQASRAISALALAGGIGVLISGAYAATPVSGLPVGLTTTQSAACAVLLGAASLLTTLRARAAKVIGQVAALLACALALQPAITAALASSFASLPPLPEHPLAQWLLDPAAMPAATSLMFAVTALSLFCTPLRGPGATHVFAAVAGFGLLAVATSLMGFALQSSSLASLGLAQVPAPLNTVTAGLLLMAALAQRGDAGWLSALLSPSAAGSSARGIIVWTVLAPLALALLALAGERLGYYDLRFAFALLASTMCCILTALVLWNAARVERAHAHAESARDAMQLLADRLRLARTATGIGIWEWLPASREWRSIDGGERLDPSANEYLEAGLARSLRDGRAEFEFPLVRASHGEHPPGENSPDGNPRLQRWMFAKCWKEVRGGDAVIVGISLDITERRHAALALEVSETRLQLAARALPGFVYDWNRASGKVLRTSGVEQMLGYQEAEVSPAGRWWDELIHVDDAPLASPARVARAAGPDSEIDSIASEYRVRHRDGRYVWVWDHCVLVRDRSGQVTRVVGSVLDITERKEAEARLAASEHRFKAALLANTGMIWTFAPDGMAQGEQTSWSAFTGQRAEELQGMGWLDAIHPDDVDSTREAWRKALDSGQELITVHRVRRRDGVYRTFSVHAVTVTDERGHITEWVGSHTDITEQRELEAEREALLAAERAARHELIAASKVKDEFLATISHELRTPLNAILGWTTLLQRPRVDAATLRDGLKVIERNARAQTQLLGDLLDANQLMSGKLSLAFEPMDFNEVVRATLDSMRVSVAARKVRIEARLSGESLPVLGDPVRLQQVISNLLSNAIKFTPQDGLITVATDCRDDVACCEVRDSGEGISAEFLPHVFEKFRQADSGGARRFAGLGLGLAITRQLVESHGGSISAHSEGRGKGAAFRVRLPRLASAHIPVARMAQAGNDKPLAGLSILAVDDEADSREYLERMLAEQGADVVSVASGAEALAVLETGAERFNLLVSDIGMPDSTGYELIESVRQRLHVAPHVLPAVALTAFARQEDRARALDKGFQKHLVKPVQVGRLIGAIRQLTGRQQPRAMRPRGTSDQRPDIRV